MLLIVSLLPGAASRVRAEALSARPVWTVTEVGDRVLRIDVEVPAPVWQAETGDRGRYAVGGFPTSALEQHRPLPSLQLVVAVPPTGDVAVHATPEGVAGVGHDLAEIPSVLGAGEAAEFEIEAPSGWRSADPQGFVQYRAPGWGGDLRLLRLRVLPLRPGSDGALLAAERIRVRISFAAEILPDDEGTGREGRGLGRLYERTVINPEQARRWRRPPGVRPAKRRGDYFDTATSDWLRIEIARRGVYVITGDDLEAAGVSVATIDLDGLRLFCGPPGELPADTPVDSLPNWMEPCALWIEDPDDGFWGPQTKLYFVGNGPDGWREDLGLAPSEDDRFYNHPTSNRYTYWLCWGGSFTSDPLRAEIVDARPGELPLSDQALARLHIEKNRIYDPRPRERELAWERYLYAQVTASAAQIPATIRCELDGVVPGGEADFRVSLWGKDWRHADPLSDHYAVVLVDGDTLSTLAWDGVFRETARGTREVAGEAHTVQVYVPQRQSSLGQDLKDNIYVAWVQVDYPRGLTVSADSLDFFVEREEVAASGLRISGLTTNAGWLLLDASDPRKPRRLLDPRIAPAGDEGFAAEFAFTPEDSLAHLVLLQTADAAKPESIRRQSWHSQPLLRRRTAPIDYLIVTHEEFREAAEALAAHRTQYFWGAAGDSAMTGRVLVVTVDQVLDEFAWGQYDPTAVRNLVVFARENWRSPGEDAALSHLLLCGNAYYDPRGYVASSARDYVSSYMYYLWGHQFSSTWIPYFIADGWFSMVDGADDEIPDIAVGRLPATSEEEAAVLVDKIIQYDTQAPQGEWRTRLLFAADDICQSYRSDGLGFTHMKQTQELSVDWSPVDARQERLFLYEYGETCDYDRKPEATADLMAHIADGALLFNYTGHGSEIQLADERLLETSSIASLENDDLPFLLITASCAVGKFAHGGDGFALAAIQRPGAGAIATFSASAIASAGYNFNLNKYLLKELFPTGTVLEPAAFGPAVMVAKWRSAKNNDRRYNLLGDPGTRFAVPGMGIDLTLAEVPGVPAGADTLVRGALARLDGQVVTTQGEPVTDFTGRARILILDSEILRIPLLDDSTANYNLPGARLYSGEVDLTGGTFSSHFFVPTALLSGPRGPARIYAYAEVDGDGDGDASGALPNLFIPEIAQAVTDTIGPAIALTWEAADETPAEGSRLRATLTDSSGIYVAALSTSRSVIVTISDADDRILAAEDLADGVVFGADFREGSLAYSIPGGLPTGEPLRLTLAASDNVGQRGSATLVFSLAGVAGADWKLLSRVVTMPNPMETETHFLFDLDRMADLKVDIFTSTGRRIQTLEAASVAPDAASSQGLAWDGRDADGDPLANGVYFYRVVATDRAGHSEERIERLVVLR